MLGVHAFTISSILLVNSVLLMLSGLARKKACVPVCGGGGGEGEEWVTEEGI